jgi:hypothetical protein
MKIVNDKNCVRQPNELYATDPFTYDCKERKHFTKIIAFWYLGVDMGCDSPLAKSSRVICDQANGCDSHANGKCPLSKGYGEELNKLKVIVMQNETPFITEFKGEKLLVSASAQIASGQYIWFGRTTVLATTDRAQA